MPPDTSARRRGLDRFALFSSALVVAIGLAGCGSQLTQSRLIQDNDGGAAGPPAAVSGGRAALGSVSPGPLTSAPVVTSGSTGAGSQSVAPSDGSVAPTGAGASTATSPGAAVGAGTSTSPSAATGPAPATCAQEKAPIVIGTVGEQSGFIGSFIRTGPIAVAAWAASVNATGGIDCHPVKYIIVDDGGDPARNQALTEQLVEQDHVIAFVHLDAPIAGQASVSYLTSHHIPAIGNETGSPWFYTSPSFFPQSSTGAATLEGVIYGAAKVFVPQGKLRLATFACVEASICSVLTQVAKSTATKAGFTLVDNFTGSLAQPDYTSACQAAQQAKAQVLVFAFDPNSAARLEQSCSSVGYHPDYVTGGPVVNATVLQNPNFNNLIDVSVVMPPTANLPAAATFRSTMAQYAPGIGDDGAAMTGWVSAQVFAAAAANMPDIPTSAAVLQGLWSLKGFDAGGLTAPLTFTQGQDAPPEICYWVSRVVNGTVVPLSTQRSCA